MRDSGRAVFRVPSYNLCRLRDLIRQVLVEEVVPFFFFFFFFNLTYSLWTSSLPSCLWSLRIFPSLPGLRLTILR